MSLTSSGARRRATFRSIHAATGSVIRRTARLLSDEPSHIDADLLAGCIAYCRIKRRRVRLPKALGRRGEEDAGESDGADLHSKGSLVLAHVAAQTARTLDGHRARAAAILEWDDGQLIGLADQPGYLEDRLLLALLVDLVQV
jgi:hypothetical protein